MLAAAYGVCMALHSRPARKKFRSLFMPKFALCIFARMFDRSAPNSTTHALTRDYGRRIVQIALFHDRFLLNGEEKRRITLPFKDGGRREWPTMSDPSEGKYRRGNSPLGMDFANYTIGGLVRDRRNYDFDNPEYKRVLGQITWRVYDLGYSLERFGSIDQEIAADGHYSRGDRPPVERYGKKFSRIAFFELLGVRQDEGLLKDYRVAEDGRLTEVDIDPSFPENQREVRLMEDLLASCSPDTRKWVTAGEVPELSNYLVRDAVAEEPGPWILLDGGASQQNKPLERISFVRLTPIILLKEDVAELTRLSRTSAPELGPGGIPEDHYTFAGEIPWSGTYPQTELDTVPFVVGTTTRPMPKTPAFTINFVGPDKKVSGTKKFTLPEFQTVNLYKRIAYYSPVRDSQLSSGTLPRPSSTVLSKEVALAMNLWLDLPSWNMRDGVGQLATLSLAGGEYWTREHYLYIRKDVLDEFLNPALCLAWMVLGERQHYGDRHVNTQEESFGYRQYRALYIYQHGRAVEVVKAKHYRP